MATPTPLQRIADALKVITDCITLKPDETALQLAQTGGGGMNFKSAAPVSTVAVVNDDSEVTALQSGQTRFIDSRDTTLWEYDGEQWSSSPYTGDAAFLRPKTLCFSPPNGRFYYYSADLTLHQVNTTTANALS